MIYTLVFFKVRYINCNQLKPLSLSSWIFSPSSFPLRRYHWNGYGILDSRQREVELGMHFFGFGGMYPCGSQSLGCTLAASYSGAGMAFRNIPYRPLG